MQHPTTLQTEAPGPSPDQAPPHESIESTVLRRLGTISTLMDSLIASWHSTRQVLHARRWHRFRYEKPVAVTPLDDATEQPIGETLLATGRDISKGGISFAHVQPLTCCKVAVTLQLDDGGCESIVTELKWCRFTRDGVYHSGGQFQRMIELPCAAGHHWDELELA